jgi:glycosyltransferase involved in cell wall biosynthesis
MAGKVAFVSTFPPTKCGIANYTYNLIQSMAVNEFQTEFQIVTIRDPAEEIDNSSTKEFLWYLRKDQIGDFRSMADKINGSDDIQVVSLQHEFGLYYGFFGSYILEFIDRLEKPLVTTFHTINETSTELQSLIQQEIAERSRYIVSINHRASQVIHQITNVPKDKIVHIPFGVPDPVSIEERDELRKKLGWTDRKVCMTFGILQPYKGIELILDVLSEVKQTVPEVLYVIMGETHPHIKRLQGESYREKLMNLVIANGLENNVQFLNVYLDETELNRHVAACDLYLTPYPGTEQVSSGTLSHAIGMGRAVLSTPFSHAKDLLAGYDTLLVPYDDRERWTRKIIQILSDDNVRYQWEQEMTRIGNNMRWSHVGALYRTVFEAAQCMSQEVSLIKDTSMSEADILEFWRLNLKLPYAMSEDEIRRFWDLAGIPYELKVNTVVEYGKRFGIRNLVETGTYRGEMVQSVLNHFNKIISIELSDQFAQAASKKFITYPQVNIVQGDSGQVLGTILQQLGDPCLFWLDAHYSGADTARGSLDTPILHELDHIFSHPIQNHVILIDDARCFIGPNPVFRNYPTIQELKDFVTKKRPDLVFEVRDDIIRIHK